jgi:hypothetical protein
MLPTNPGPRTAPVSKTGKQWCPKCKKDVYWTPGAATGKPRCNICGNYTSPLDDDRPTEPIIRAATVVAQDNTIDLVLCTKCGNHYSSGKCDKGHDQSYIKRGI